MLQFVILSATTAFPGPSFIVRARVRPCQLVIGVDYYDLRAARARFNQPTPVTAFHSNDPACGGGVGSLSCRKSFVSLYLQIVFVGPFR